LAHLFRVDVPEQVSSSLELPPVVPSDAPQFVQEVTAKMMAGKGDQLAVSQLPYDGTYPSGTTAWEKRNVSQFVPEWVPELCIQCGNCSFVCPHSVIRAKFYNQKHLQSAPEAFKTAPLSARGFPEIRYTLQIYIEDCTGCNLCVNVCPAISMKESGVKAINMQAKAPLQEQEKENIRFFETLPVNNRARVDFSSVRGAQFLQPLFEFSGACAGCGETPYVKLVSQLFGDRLIVANATGCSSIYGGNLPTTPWTKDAQGRGPAWSNSLFEDNAEFGLGFRLTADKHLALAGQLLRELRLGLDDGFINELLDAPQKTESQIFRQRERVAELKAVLLQQDSEQSRNLLSVVDHLVRRSIWIMGGDGWAYDIGSGGLDHILASGRDVNVLVMDTEVYSNTGGQMSKSTPLGAVAKFAAAGKPVAKKDIALQAISYGNVYVARIAMGANSQQTLVAMREAEAYPGPSLILAYSHCIAHGINMQNGLKQQDLATASGYWPLVRYNPMLRKSDKNPFVLDSPRPRIAFKDYAYNELRYTMLLRTNPDEADHMLKLAQQVVNQKWEIYEKMAAQHGNDFNPDAGFSD
jgi:pyruvate-ferredoxin/flavodoxin oxidoreductase